MGTRKLLRGDVIVSLLFIASSCWGISTWFKKHQQETKRESESKAQIAADTERAKSALTRMRATWNADDSWEHQVYPTDNSAPAYSLDVEHALVKGHPIIVIGEIQDVRTSQGQATRLVLVQSHSSPNLVDLRFSLETPPEVANSILSATRNAPLPGVETFIAVVTIERVEKIEQPPDKADNDQDYFLAHGTLHETYDTHLLAVGPKELGED